MRRLVRTIANGADRFLQRRPLSILAFVTALCIVAEIFLLRGVETALDAIHRATAGPVVASRAADLASRSDRD
jgi:hypothetical protein